MVTIEEILAERACDFLEIQLRYLLDDGMIDNQAEKAYFSSKEYRGYLEGLMKRDPDKLLNNRNQSSLYFPSEGWSK